MLLEVGLLRPGDRLGAAEGTAVAVVEETGALSVGEVSCPGVQDAAAAAGFPDADGWEFWAMPGTCRPLAQVRVDLEELLDARRRFSEALSEDPGAELCEFTAASSVDVSRYDGLMPADVPSDDTAGRVREAQTTS